MTVNRDTSLIAPCRPNFSTRWRADLPLPPSWRDHAFKPAIDRLKQRHRRWSAAEQRVIVVRKELPLLHRCLGQRNHAAHSHLARWLLGRSWRRGKRMRRREFTTFLGGDNPL